MSSQNTYKPGEVAESNVKLYVKDENGNTLGEINVPAGNRIPTTRIKDAEYYTTKE
jgi:hypothetical protein